MSKLPIELLPEVISVISILVSTYVGIYVTKQESRIQNKFDNQIEKLKVEYGSLYEKRVHAIEGLYAILYEVRILRSDISELLYQFREYDHELPTEMQRNVDSLLSATDKFVDLVHKNRIYFSTITLDKLNAVIDLFDGFVANYNFYEEVNGEEIINFMDTGYEKVFFINIDEKINIVENEFRVLIGEREIPKKSFSIFSRKK